MSKYLALCVVSLLFPAIANAQDEVIKDFSRGPVEKFIKEVMKADVAGKVDEKTQLIVYSTPDQQFDVLIRTAPGQRALFFVYEFQALRGAPEKLNSWNYQFHHTHAATSPNGKLSLQANLNTEAGLSQRQLRNFYDQIQQEREAFAKFVEGK